MKSLYQILGVAKKATPKEIKVAYYNMAKKCHPDASETGVEASKFQEITEAYEVLGDPEKRRVYDSRFRSDVPYRYKERPSEPISMKHLNHVFKVLNKPENEEKADFLPFSDHNYPGSDYNRFEYSRTWDVDLKQWVYVRRPTAGAYEKDMETRFANVQYLWTVMMLFVTGFFIWQKFIYPNQPKVPSEATEQARLKIIMDLAREEQEEMYLRRALKFDGEAIK